MNNPLAGFQGFLAVVWSLYFLINTVLDLKVTQGTTVMNSMLETSGLKFGGKMNQTKEQANRLMEEQRLETIADEPDFDLDGFWNEEVCARCGGLVVECKCNPNREEI